jgi:capsular exopolysaccharide synthesis family protein
VLGLIPLLPAEEAAAGGEIGLICHTRPRSTLSESYRAVRTGLEFCRRSRPAQVLLVTSPHSGDGKSTSASNLAITLALAGRRVLLVDGDLRKPSQHQIQNCGRERGLAHVLKGLLPVSRAVHRTAVEGLDLLAAGPEVPNPAELFASRRLGDFLEEVRQLYDSVIIDSSPLLAVTDPCVIGSACDGIVLVVRATTLRRHEAERAKELLDALGVPVLGTVVNGITREQVGYGYGQAYGYGYGYGYGSYGSSETRKSLGGPPASPLAGLVNGNGNGDAAHHEPEFPEAE